MASFAARVLGCAWIVDAGRRGQVGLSWFLTKRKDHRIVYHGGTDVGFNSAIVLAPDESISIVAMSNFLPDKSGYASQIANSAIDMILGERSK